MPLRYKIRHTTVYDYTEPVSVCQNETRLKPRTEPQQTCSFHRLLIDPEPSIAGQRRDYFGNTVDWFSINVRHRRLRVTSISNVDVHAPAIPDPAASPPWETVRDYLRTDRQGTTLDAYQFAFDSPLVRCSTGLANYAEKSFPAGRPILLGVLDLTQRIHSDFPYDTRATTVHTAIEEVFRLRRGVCQDLAHVQIGCLRSLGLGARYASGYLRTMPPTGKPKLVGADASHAWLSVYCGALGWIDADPTNNLLPREDHILVAWGRDYSDVCPINGMFVGGGGHSITVAVDVLAL